jgi:hypothetical protein
VACSVAFGPQAASRSAAVSSTGTASSLLAGFAGADADHLLHVAYEDLAVADLAGTSRLGDCLDRALHQRIGHHRLDLHLGQEVDHVLGAAIQLRVALLPAEALDVGDGEPSHSRLGERLADFVELEGLDDGGDLFHDQTRVSGVGKPMLA